MLLVVTYFVSISLTHRHSSLAMSSSLYQCCPMRSFCCNILLFFYFILFFKLYIIVLLLPSIKMNRPQVYMCSPSWTLLPPHTIPLSRPSALAPSIQYRASNLDWQLVSYMIFYMFPMPFSQIFPPSPSPTESIRLFLWNEFCLRVGISGTYIMKTFVLAQH